MQVPAVPMWVVGDETHGDGPVDLGAVDPCFLMVDDHQQMWSRPRLAVCRHVSFFHLRSKFEPVTCQKARPDVAHYTPGSLAWAPFW